MNMFSRKEILNFLFIYFLGFLKFLSSKKDEPVLVLVFSAGRSAVSASEFRQCVRAQGARALEGGVGQGQKLPGQRHRGENRQGLLVKK